MSLDDEVRTYLGTSYAERGVGELADGVMGGLFRATPTMAKVARALRLWATMGDPTLRDHCNGLSFRSHRNSVEMVVYVDSNIWMYEFQMRSFEILREWRARCERTNQEDLIVDKVTFRLSRRAREGGFSEGYSNHDEAVPPQPVPLSPEERREAVDMVSGITDPTLREHVLNALISVKEWKKSSRS